MPIELALILILIAYIAGRIHGRKAHQRAGREYFGKD